jgi:hypothetical protein
VERAKATEAIDKNYPLREVVTVILSVIVTTMVTLSDNCCHSNIIPSCNHDDIITDSVTMVTLSLIAITMVLLYDYWRHLL